MRPVRAFLLATTLTALPAAAALAQGSGFNPSAFAKFREQHKYTFQLLTTTSRGFTECERSQSSRIKPDQAKKILGLLAPLRKQPTLTQDDAKTTIQKLQRVLDTKQLTAVDKAIKDSAMRRAGGGGAPGGAPGGGAPGGGAPGGGAPGGGAGRPGGTSTFDPAKAKNFNPFNPQPGTPRYEMRKVSNGKLFAFLEARAAGKDAKLDLPLPGGPGGARPGAPGAPGAGNPR